MKFNLPIGIYIILGIFGLLGLLSQSANAIILHLGPGQYKQVIYAPLGGQGTGTFTIQNYNNHSLNVTFEAQGDIASIISIPNSIYIEPGRTGNVTFTVEPTENKTYSGKVQINYLLPDLRSAALLESSIRVVISGKNENETETNFSSFPVVSTLVLIAAVSLVYFVIKFRKGK